MIGLPTLGARRVGSQSRNCIITNTAFSQGNGSRLMYVPVFDYTKQLQGDCYRSTSFRVWSPEQGGASRAEAAPSVEWNRESISVSGLYFFPFRHIQTAFQFYLIFLSYLSRPSLTWFWFTYFVVLDGLCAKQSSWCYKTAAKSSRPPSGSSLRVRPSYRSAEPTTCDLFITFCSRLATS